MVTEKDGKLSRGLGFASAHQLEVLRRRDYLSHLDAAHKTSWLAWFLYTILIHDEQGNWLPMVVLSQRRSPRPKVGLYVHRQECSHAQGLWTLGYMLSDDPAA